MTMDPTFSAALRTELVTRANRSRRPRRRVLWGAGLGMAAVAAGGVAWATGALQLPGGTQSAALSGAIEATGTGPGEVDLGTAPSTATHAYVELTCLDGGMFTFPDGAALSCGPADLGSLASYSIPVSAVDGAVRIGAPDGASWSAVAYWTHEASTAWGTNEAGQTYGVANENGTPDLLAVIATNGEAGYVHSADLEQVHEVSSPEEALERQATATPVSLPVFETDGRTQIGEFSVGRP